MDNPGSRVDDSLLAETLHYVAIRRLQDAYADVVTRRAWPELAELFRPDAIVEVDRRVGEPLRLVGPGEVGDFIAGAIADFAFFEFVVLSTRIEIARDGDRATARMYMCELRQEASGRFTVAYGVYHDVHVNVDGRWWFVHRRYHSLARTAASTDVFPFPHDLRLDTL